MSSECSLFKMAGDSCFSKSFNSARIAKSQACTLTSPAMLK